MNTRTGCSQKPTFLQVFTYMFYVSNIIITYFHILLLDEYIIHLIIFSIIVILSLYNSLKTTLTDPTDTIVIVQQQRRGESFDYEEHQLNQFCEICIAYVKDSSKHCKQCNRCCEDFDHHCIWINNCVGGKNYKSFILMIVFTSVFLLYSFIINARIIQSIDNLNYSQLLFKYSQQSVLIISIIYLILEIIGHILLIQLILFHLYLSIVKMTTYEYIVKKRIQAVLPSNNSDMNIINNNDGQNNKNDQDQTIVFKQDNNIVEVMQKNDSNGTINQDISQDSQKKRKHSQGEDETQKEPVITFLSQRNTSGIDIVKMKRSQEIKTPELTQFH